jgi:hypothetical protein
MRETKDQHAIRAYYRAYHLSPEAAQRVWDAYVAGRPKATEKIVDDAHRIALATICQGCLSEGHVHKTGTICQTCGH